MLDNKNIKPVQLGLSKNNRPRSIKVILKDEHMVNNIISAKTYKYQKMLNFCD